MKTAAAILKGLAPGYSRVRLRDLEGRLAEFLAWWSAELQTLVPVRWRQLFLPGRRRVLYQVADAFVRVHVADGAGEREALVQSQEEVRSGLTAANSASIPNDDGPPLSNWLVVPSKHTLRRHLTLPLTAGDRLRDVLTFEIERQTPFALDQVVFDHRVLQRDVGTQLLKVELVVLPEATMRETAACFPGLDLAGIDVRTDEGHLLGVNLLPQEERKRLPNHVGRTNLGLASVALVLSGLALWQVLGNREDALTALTRRVEGVRLEARRAEELRRRLALTTDSMDFLEQIQSRKPASIDLLAELTRQLPDDTWIEHLTANEGKIALVAHSSEAASLVARLQKSNCLHGVALSGSVAPDPDGGTDRFSLTAELVGKPVVARQPTPARRPSGLSNLRSPSDAALQRERSPLERAIHGRAPY